MVLNILDPFEPLWEEDIEVGSKFRRIGVQIYWSPLTGLPHLLTDKKFLNKQYQFTESYPNFRSNYRAQGRLGRPVSSSQMKQRNVMVHDWFM